jgi:hypothetical protein
VKVLDLFERVELSCDICGKSLERKDARLDHDRGTGIVRGWLCNACNVGLGLFGDDIDMLVEAARYLRKHGKRKAIPSDIL